MERKDAEEADVDELPWLPPKIAAKEAEDEIDKEMGRCEEEGTVGGGRASLWGSTAGILLFRA